MKKVAISSSSHRCFLVRRGVPVLSEWQMNEEENARFWQKDAVFSGAFSGVVSAHERVKKHLLDLSPLFSFPS
jgi:hypothetical protein